MVDVVFDTTVFLRGVMNPRSRWGRLLFEHTDRYALSASIPTLRETLDVITRPGLVRKYRGLAGDDIQRVLALLATVRIVEPAEIGPVCRDPNDDVFIATAVAAGAAVLVSEDRDLLELGGYAGVRILAAADFLATLADLD